MRGEITLDLVAAVPIVANWPMTSIARRSLRKQTEGSSPASIGRARWDGATTRSCWCLARLGLRAGEVMSLELDDIDLELGSSPCAARAAGASCRLRRMSAKRSWRTLHHGRPECALGVFFPHQGTDLEVSTAQAAWYPWSQIASKRARHQLCRPLARISFRHDRERHAAPRCIACRDRCGAGSSSTPITTASTPRSIRSPGMRWSALARRRAMDTSA